MELYQKIQSIFSIHGFVAVSSTDTHVGFPRELGTVRMDWLGGSFRCYVIVHGNGRPPLPFCAIDDLRV